MPYGVEVVEREDSTSYAGLSWSVVYPRFVGGEAAARERMNEAVESFVNGEIDAFLEDFGRGMDEGLWTTLGVTLPTVWDEAAGRSEVPPDAVFQSDRAVSFTLVRCIEGNTMAHGFCEPTAFLFDPSTGSRLGLSDVFRPGTDYLDYLSLLAYHDLSLQLLERRGSLEYYSGIDRSGVEPTEDDFDLFTLSADSIHFGFPPYTVASYADGGFSVSLPLRSLHAYLRRDGPAGAFADSAAY